MKLGSKDLIGNVKERYKEVFRPDRRWDVWRGFYNGWIEGRINLIEEIKTEEPTAYEFHNHETGHSYVDYIPKDGMDEKDGYTIIPLHNI